MKRVWENGDAHKYWSEMWSNCSGFDKRGERSRFSILDGAKCQVLIEKNLIATPAVYALPCP